MRWPQSSSAFRADQLLAEQQLEFTALDQQVTQDKQHVASISKQISQLSAQPASSSQRARLSALREQGNRATNDLATLEQQVSASKAATKVNTATMIGGSNVLDAASPVPPHSRLKHLLLYAGGGFIIGLILGMGIVIVRALLSDRLRTARRRRASARRSRQAQRPGDAREWLAPGSARASFGPLPAAHRRVPARRCAGRLPPRCRPGRRSRRRPAGGGACPWCHWPQSCAQQGRRVVVADLCSGAPAARLLGAKGPGVHTVSVDGARLVAAVPDPAEFAPIGPLRPTSPRAQPAVRR